MDMQLCHKLIPLIPNGKIIVAESGVSNQEVIQELSEAGCDAFLIGEHFMRQDNIGAEVQRLKNSPTNLFK
jgi:indole-3-glycerol phosphate synthase